MKQTETMAIARQQPTRNNGSTVASGVSFVVHSVALSRDQPRRSEVSWLVSSLRTAAVQLL
jgi:hypothetical protein